MDAALAATCHPPETTTGSAVGAVGRVAKGKRALVTGAAGAVGSLCVQPAARAGAHVARWVLRAMSCPSEDAPRGGPTLV